MDSAWLYVFAALVHVGVVIVHALPIKSLLARIAITGIPVILRDLCMVIWAIGHRINIAELLLAMIYVALGATGHAS